MKKEYPVQQVVNWFFGNYCTRKCLENEEQLFKCRQKLETFTEKHAGTIRHREFLQLMQEGLNICELPTEQKTKAISIGASTEIEENEDLTACKTALAAKLNQLLAEEVNREKKALLVAISRR